MSDSVTQPERRFASFAVGQVIHHKLFDYRGVIIDVDSEFRGSEQWYARVAKGRPPKDRPWYRVLVHNSAGTTYVAERNLEPDTTGEPVNHPCITRYFREFRDGIYINSRMNH